jgi:molybdopterin/thiamine biosynthesis adenylyltransferase
MNVANRQPVVNFPSELDHNDFTGNLYGYFYPDSNEYNVVRWGENLPAEDSNTSILLIGKITSDPEGDGLQASSQLLGTRTSNGLIFKAGGVTCKKQAYNLLLNIFSRNTGILETDVMLDKCAIISGCGSVGSLVALELARAGLGNFLLIDNDTIAYHNLSRHQCGVRDVGKFKVNAVRERILEINPSAKVSTCVSILEDVPKEVFDEFCTTYTVIVGCADNRESDHYANRISSLYKIPFISIGLWERAFAGEIFYCIPEELPCYDCGIGTQGAGVSGRTSANRRFYTTEEDEAHIRFEPGISIDIGFVTLIAIKLMIDLLNRHTQNYIPRIINHLTQFTLVCNTSDARLGGDQAEIFSYPLQVTTSIRTIYSAPCPPCKLLS